MIVGQRDAKHRSGQDHSDRALKADRFFGIHVVVLSAAIAGSCLQSKIGEQLGAHLSAACAITPGLPAIARKRTLRAVRAITLLSRTSFVHCQRAAI
jgi:hypothetical protein